MGIEQAEGKGGPNYGAAGHTQVRGFGEALRLEGTAKGPCAVDKQERRTEPAGGPCQQGHLSDQAAKPCCAQSDQRGVNQGAEGGNKKSMPPQKALTQNKGILRADSDNQAGSEPEAAQESRAG